MRALAQKVLPSPRGSDLLIFPAFLVAGGFLLVALINSVTTTMLIIAAAALITALQWVLLRRVTGQGVPLPGILIASINVVGLTGYLWYRDLAAKAAVSAALPDGADIYHRAAIIFTTASAALFAGGMLAGIRTPPSEARGTSLRLRAQTMLDSLNMARSGWLLSLAAVPILISIAAYTPSGLWYREHYSMHAGPNWAMSLSSITTTAGTALASLLASRRANSPQSRHAAGCLLVLYALVTWAMGSRALAFIPFMLLVMLQVDPNPAHSRTRRFAVIGSLVITSIVFLQIPLSLRGRPEGAGLLPYWQILLNDPRSLVTWDGMAATIGNILFAVPLAATTAGMDSFPIHSLVTSLNPLPGAFTDWPQVKAGMQINRYTPTSAIGELANYGRPYLIAFFVILGWCLAKVQAWNARMLPLRATLASILGFGAIGGFALSLLQYNLRAGMRGIWYFLALSFVLHLLPRVKERAD